MASAPFYIEYTVRSIPPGKPRHNGFVEIFSGKLRDNCPKREWFRDLREAKVLIENWRQFHNHRRPHGALGCQPPGRTRRPTS